MVVIFCWSFIIFVCSIDYSPGNSPGNTWCFVHKQGDLLRKIYDSLEGKLFKKKGTFLPRVFVLFYLKWRPGILSTWCWKGWSTSLCVFWWIEIWTERHPPLVTISKSSLSVQTLNFWGDPQGSGWIHQLLLPVGFTKSQWGGQGCKATCLASYTCIETGKTPIIIVFEEQNTRSTMDEQISRP